MATKYWRRIPFVNHQPQLLLMRHHCNPKQCVFRDGLLQQISCRPIHIKVDGQSNGEYGQQSQDLVFAHDSPSAFKPWRTLVQLPKLSKVTSPMKSFLRVLLSSFSNSTGLCLLWVSSGCASFRAPVTSFCARLLTHQPLTMRIFH